MKDALAAAEKAKYLAVYNDHSIAYKRKSHGMMLWDDHRGIFPIAFQTAIDFGCGQGRLFGYLNDMGKDCWAVDIVANSLEDDVAKKWKRKRIIQPLWDMDFGAESGWAKKNYDTWPGTFDLGICTDVMEHIPETRVPDVLRLIAEYCDVVIFKIANFPSRSLGQDLHPTMKSMRWWVHAFRDVRPNGQIEVLPIVTSREEYFFRWRA